MAVKIRLRRMGSKHQPSYRVVVVDAREKRDGAYIESLGHYNPRSHEEEGDLRLKIDAEAAIKWLDRGAQPTETAKSLLRKAGVLKLRHERQRGLTATAEAPAEAGAEG